MLQGQEHYTIQPTLEAARAALAAQLAVKPESLVIEQDADVLDTWFSSGK